MVNQSSFIKFPEGLEYRYRLVLRIVAMAIPATSSAAAKTPK